MMWIGKGIRNRDRKRESGIKALGNRESKCCWGAFTDGVAKRFWGAFSGLGLRGEVFLGSVFGNGIAWRIVGLRIGEEDTYGQGLVGTVLEPCWIGRCWNRVGGVGTVGRRCWNRRRAVLEPAVGGVGTG
jgi:hypothetical protein